MKKADSIDEMKDEIIEFKYNEIHREKTARHLLFWGLLSLGLLLVIIFVWIVVSAFLTG